MKITNCRICSSKKFLNLFSLGKLSFTGKFAKNKSDNIPKREVTIVMCNKCKLIQLNQNFSSKFLYSNDYGYRTGINRTMSEHVKNLVKFSTKKMRLKKNDAVLDIASNDGTLLNYYNKQIIRVGIDPILNKYKKFYKKIDFKVNDFFSYQALKNKKIKIKFKVITALSMFYDLKNPNKFLNDVQKILDKNGIFVLEHADLLSLLKYNLFDSICHEHLEYYSSTIILSLMKKNGLRVFDVQKNNVNGGSTRYYISHNKSKFRTNLKSLNKLIKEEKKYKLDSVQTFKNFEKNLIKKKKTMMNFIIKQKKQNKIIHGYGASTKGNVLLQYFNITNKHIDLIADRNPQKFNKFTPGTKIKITSENYSRNKKPDYYLVLPWHFKNEIIKREKKTRIQGTKLIFPLPNLKII